MTIERRPGSASVIDVLDRVLDKGIVIDAWARLSLVGIDLVTVEARVVVASIATYLQHSDALSLIGGASKPFEIPGPRLSQNSARYTSPHQIRPAHVGAAARVPRSRKE